MMPDLTELAGALGKSWETAMNLLQRLAGPAFDEIGEHFADKVRLYRFKNAVETLDKTQRIIASSGLKPRTVPIGLLFPLLEGASLEEDDDMQSRWATLLANAALRENESELPRSFVAILDDISPAEAKLLDAMVDDLRKYAETLGGGLSGALAEDRPYDTDAIGRLYASLKLSRIPWVSTWGDYEKFPPDRVAIQKSAFGVALGNLVRLALVAPQHDWRFDKSSIPLTLKYREVQLDLNDLQRSMRRKTRYHLTTLGIEFVRACRETPAKSELS